MLFTLKKIEYLNIILVCNINNSESEMSICTTKIKNGDRKNDSLLVFYNNKYLGICKCRYCILVE